MNRNHVGAQGELLASSWLLARGYEVFRNVSASGPVDLIAWDPQTGESIKIDVKHQQKPYQRRDGVVRPVISSIQVREKAREGIRILVLFTGEVMGFLEPDGSFSSPPLREGA